MHVCLHFSYIYVFLIGYITLCTCLYVGMKWDDVYQNFFLIFKKILFIYFEGKGKRGRKRERETSLCGCFSYTPYWGPGPQPRMCPDWEPNWWPFGSQASAQSTEPHHPGLLGWIFTFSGYSDQQLVELIAQESYCVLGIDFNCFVLRKCQWL